MGIRGGSYGDPVTKLGDPAKNAIKKVTSGGGSKPTTYPLYIINKEMRMRVNLESQRTHWSFI